MPLADIKAVMATILGGVAGIGVVFTYQPLVRDEVTLKTLLDKNNVVNAWTISRESLKSAEQTVSGRADYHQMCIRGFYALQTSDPANLSEPVFEGLVEGVRTAFNSNRYLKDAQGVKHSTDGSVPIQIKTQGFAMVVGVLCHYVELTLPVREYPAAPDFQ